MAGSVSSQEAQESSRPLLPALRGHRATMPSASQDAGCRHRDPGRPAQSCESLGHGVLSGSWDGLEHMRILSQGGTALDGGVRAAQKEPGGRVGATARQRRGEPGNPHELRGQPASGTANTPTPRLLLPRGSRTGTLTPLPFKETRPTGVAGLVWVHAATQDGAQTELTGCHMQCDYRWLDGTSVTCGHLRSSSARDLARWILGGTESSRPLMARLPPPPSGPCGGLQGRVCPR